MARAVGITRQNYYARRRRRQRRKVDGDLVAGLVRRERQQQGRLGTRKLYHMLQAEFKKAGVRIGRDRMFERSSESTTCCWSRCQRNTLQRHSLTTICRCFRNVIKELESNGPQPGVGQ